MAWSISITVEGWQEIREELETWTAEKLIDAIVDDKFEHVLERGGQHHAERAAEAERKRLEGVPHDLLVDQAFELVEANDTCENGGYGYWVDREGYHKVWLG
jgi:hypothetical protein